MAQGQKKKRQKKKKNKKKKKMLGWAEMFAISGELNEFQQTMSLTYNGLSSYNTVKSQARSILKEKNKLKDWHYMTLELVTVVLAKEQRKRINGPEQRVQK